MQTAPRILSAEDIDSIVNIETALKTQISGDPGSVLMSIEYKYPDKTEKVSVEAKRVTGDLYQAIHLFRSPGFYDIPIVATGCGTDTSSLEAKIRDALTDRIGRSPIEISEGDDVGPVAGTSYDTWQRSFYPLLESVGVSAETRQRIDAYQASGRDVKSVSVEEMLGAGKGLLIYEIINPGYQGVDYGVKVYEALEIPKTDADLLRGMLT